jgi:hypothetical protein
MVKRIRHTIFTIGRKQEKTPLTPGFFLFFQNLLARYKRPLTFDRLKPKLKMKTKKIVLILGLFFIASAKILAQPFCTTQSQSSSPSSSSQSTNCINFLTSFVPNSNDPIIEVNVNFWVFVPTYTPVNQAVWTFSADPTTSADAQACLDVANSTFTSIPSTPQLTVASNPVSMSTAKIKLVLKTFSVVVNNEAYTNIGGFGGSHPKSHPWQPKDGINIMLGIQTTTSQGTNTLTTPASTYVVYHRIGGNIAAGGDPALFPFNYIYVNPAFHYTTQPIFHDNIRSYGGTIAHEVGHYLGLHHPTGPFTNTGAGQGEPPSSVFGVGCCNEVFTDDYVMESYPCWSCITQQGCGTPGASDNLMSSNSGCNRYLSPQQMAVMHYYLRSSLSDLLTASSKTTALDVNPAFDYSVTTNETWQDMDRYFKGNITVKSNKTLTIKCGLAMTRNAKITVEPGGLLVIDGGTITCLSGLWEGIELKGNPLQPQAVSNPSNTGALLYQPLLRIKNGGTISSAKVGVKNYAGNWNKASGVIFAQDGVFLNNLRDVEFRTPFAGLYQNISWFQRCTFKTTGSFGHGYPNLSHIFLYKTYGVNINGCNFVYAGSHGAGYKGIDCEQSIFTLTKDGTTPSTFENLLKGIDVNNINPLAPPSITNTKFKDNVVAAYFRNVNYLSFTSNTVQILNASNAEGVYLNNCKYYNIRNNDFSNDGVGIAVYKSGSGAHNIFRNTFSNLVIGVNCMDNNGNQSLPDDGLKINCNDFNNQNNTYDVAMTYTNYLVPPTVNKKQGEVNSQFANSGNVVRNIYGATCSYQNMWYIDATATDTIYHGSNTNSVTAITQPTSAAWGCKSPYLRVVNKNIHLDYQQHCPSNPLSAGGSSTVQSNKLATINGYASDLRVNNSNGLNDFEIQTAVASKLNIFLTDSAGPLMDSVITILQNNEGAMEDSEIQLVFARMLNGEYDVALDLVENFPSGELVEWAELFETLIPLERDTIEGIFGLALGNESLPYFTELATEQSSLKALAESVLITACDSVFSEPHAVPTGSNAGQKSTKLNENEAIKTFLKVYPIPSSDLIHLEYTGIEPVTVALKDLLGKVIYLKFIDKAGTCVIPFGEISNGMYLLTVSSHDKQVYTTKVLRQGR